MKSKEEIEKGICAMEEQRALLESKAFAMRSELAKRAYDMDAMDIVAVANRIGAIEQRIEVGKGKLEIARSIVR